MVSRGLPGRRLDDATGTNVADRADQRIGTREEHQQARLRLLEAEKEHTRRGDELAAMRRALHWVRISKQYVFDTSEGEKTLAQLFAGRSQLLVYHFMSGPDWTEGCPVCSFWADSFHRAVLHLSQRDVTMVCASRAPLERIAAWIPSTPPTSCSTAPHRAATKTTCPYRSPGCAAMTNTSRLIRCQPDDRRNV